MLILTRKVNESIHIGEDVVVTVHRLTGNRVRLAIDAPKDIKIARQEIYQPPQTPPAAA